MTGLLEIRKLRTYFYTSAGCIRAVDGVSFTVDKGDALGLAGESGSGKTTVALSVMRLVKPPGKIVSGQILYDGEDLVVKSRRVLDTIRWRKISMIFQGAMNALNPVYNVRDQIVEAILQHEKVTKIEAWDRAQHMLKLVGISPSRARDYPHEFSGGMRQRAVIAMALALSPSLVIADEPTTALDVLVERQILDLIAKLKEELGVSILLITHDLSVISELCKKVGIFYAGKIVEFALVKDLISDPLHPYTQGLLEAFPRVSGPKKRLEPIRGNPPSLIAPPTGCSFHPRCPFAMAICRTEKPKLITIRSNRMLACHLYTR
jgi:peptide/nickel transport system ATP-binding protein